MSTSTPSSMVNVARIFLAVAGLLSLWLGLAGLGMEVAAGDSNACVSAYSSNWGFAYKIPIGLLGAVCYLTLAVLGKATANAHGSRAGMVGLTAAFTSMVAAIYFSAIQVLAIGEMCPWCGLAHGLAVGGGGVLIWHRYTVPVPSDDGSHQAVYDRYAGIVSVALLGLLGLSQALPDNRNNAAVSFDLDRDQADATIVTLGPQAEAMISMHEGRFTIDPNNLNVVGDTSAEQVITVLADYGSSQCRDLMKRLRLLQAAMPESIAVIELPATENEKGAEVHRLMLTLKRLNPEAYGQLSADLLNDRVPADPDGVIRAIVRHVPTEDFHTAYTKFKRSIDAAMASTRSVQKENAGFNRMASLPQVMMGGKILIGDLGNLEKYAELVEPLLSAPLSPKTRDFVKRHDDFVLVASPREIALGMVTPGSTHDHKITLTNEGNHPVDVSWVRIGNGCQLNNSPSGTIEPNDSMEMEVTVTAPFAKGAWESALTIHNSGSSTGTSVRMRAEVSTLAASTTASPVQNQFSGRRP